MGLFFWKIEADDWPEGWDSTEISGGEYREDQNALAQTYPLRFADLIARDKDLPNPFDD